MAKKNLYINNTSLGTYGIYISSDTVLNAPSFDYVEHQVPGRDGTLLQYNNRLNNVVRKFTCYVPSVGSPTTAIANLKKLIYSSPGYVKITSDYDSSTYQYGYLAQDIQVKPFARYKTIEFDLYFSCLPKKYATTQTTATNTYVVVDADGLFQGIWNRNSTLVQNIFNDVDSSYIPDDAYYYVFNLSSTSLTSLTASWSQGNLPFFLFKANGLDNYEETVAYSNAGLSVTSATSTYGLYLMCPVFIKGTITVSWTDQDSNAQTFTTNDFSSKLVTLTNATSMGCNLESLEIEYRPMNAFGNTAEAVLFLESYLNNTKTGSMAISLKLRTLASSQALDYRTFLSQQAGHDKIYSMTADVNVETLKTVFKKTGLPDLQADPYFEITGNLGLCDTIYILAPTKLAPQWYETHTNPGYGYVYDFDVKARWWSL